MVNRVKACIIDGNDIRPLLSAMLRQRPRVVAPFAIKWNASKIAIALMVADFPVTILQWPCHAYTCNPGDNVVHSLTPLSVVTVDPGTYSLRRSNP